MKILLLTIIALLFVASSSQSAPQRDVDWHNVEYHKTLRFPERISKQGSVQTFANLRTGRVRQGKYIPLWSTAKIDTSKVKKVTFMVVSFPIAGVYTSGHAQMVFDMEKGSFESSLGPHEGVVASFSALRPKGVSYNAAAGMLDRYKSIWLLCSKKEIFDKAEIENGHVELYELKLNAKVRQKLLDTFLYTSFQRRQLEVTPYHLLRNSCITNQFRIMRLVFDWNKSEPFPMTSIPRKAGETLIKTGLVTESYRLLCPHELRRFRLNQKLK